MTTPTNQSMDDAPLVKYMRQPDKMEKFENLLGKEGAEPFVQSVLLVVASDEKLRDCTPQSVFKSAVRAATLELSCDPALKQGWIVPYNKNIAKKGEQPKWIKEAQFQPHYLGLRSLAMRTGRYWTINVSPVYEGQRVLFNPLTGLHVVEESNGFVGQPRSYTPGLVDVTTRRTKDMKIIGWIAYYKAKNGEEKSVYMSVMEIDDHARKYVKDYEKNQNWSDPDKRSTMEMKTVLRRLLDWTDKSGKAGEKLAAALQADTEPEPEIVDGSSEDVPNTDLHPMTYEEACQVVAMVNGKEKPMSELTKEQLTNMFENSMLSVNVEAAKIILKHTYNVEAKPAEKKSVEQIRGQLGFK